MTTYWPDYCKDFRCIASECRHTCCAGWTICIDEKSLARFGQDPWIAREIDDGCFVLREDGMCPFLRDDKLCEMILSRGEDCLCDICKEHPRFYNCFEDRTEAGIGLVCEEACRLVLDHEGPFELASEDGSKLPLPSYVVPVFDSSLPLSARLAKLTGGVRSGSKMRAMLFAQMEVMDPAWSSLLSSIVETPVSAEDEDRVIDENSSALANLAAYLLYRYKGASRFAAEATYLVADLVSKGCEVHDAARMFSGEVEYSDINIDEAMETFA